MSKDIEIKQVTAIGKILKSHSDLNPHIHQAKAEYAALEDLRLVAEKAAKFLSLGYTHPQPKGEDSSGITRE